MTTRATACLAKGKARQKAVYSMVLPSLISTTSNVNLPCELLTILMISSVFCTYSKKKCQICFFFWLFHSKGKWNTLLMLFHDIQNTYTGHVRNTQIDVQTGGPVLMWCLVAYLLCFQINIYFSDVSLLYAKIWALIIGKKITALKIRWIFGLWLDIAGKIKKYNDMWRLYTWGRIFKAFTEELTSL